MIHAKQTPAKKVARRGSATSTKKKVPAAGKMSATISPMAKIGMPTPGLSSHYGPGDTPMTVDSSNRKAGELTR